MHGYLNVRIDQILEKRYNGSTVLSVFAISKKVASNLVMSVRPSARMEIPGSQ